MHRRLIIADQASFRFGARTVVDRFSFALSEGEFVGILGPNGAGKSTILKGLSGLLVPDEGRIAFDGASANGHKPKRDELARMIAVVPQNASLPETFTASEVVMMGRNPHLGLLQGEGERDWRVVAQAMARTDTLAMVGRRIGELSGGERQRVLIARALAQEPRVLLLDEPTTHLDLSHQFAVLDLIQRLHRESGLAVVAVFHDLNLAAQYCERLILLTGGRIAAAGKPEEVITAANVARVYGARIAVLAHPTNGLPITVPLAVEDARAPGVKGFARPALGIRASD